MSDSIVDFQEVLQQIHAASDMAPELVEIFGEEAEEHLRTIYASLDHIRKSDDHESALADIRRSSHTLKGAAGAVGQQAVTRLAHRMEDLLDELAGNHAAVATDEQIDLLLATADQMADLTAGVDDPETTATTLVEIYQRYDAAMASIDKLSDAQDASSNPSQSTAKQDTESDTQSSDSESVEAEFNVDELVAAMAQLEDETIACDVSETETAPVADAVTRDEVVSQIQSGQNMDSELREIFSEESETHMRTIYDSLDRLRVDSRDAAALSDIRRSSHTLKGAAGAVGFEVVTRLAHRMEDLLDHLADSNQAVDDEQILLLLSTADALQDLTTDQTSGDEGSMVDGLLAIYAGYQQQMESIENQPGTLVADHATAAVVSEREERSEQVQPEQPALEQSDSEQSESEQVESETPDSTVTEVPSEDKTTVTSQTQAVSKSTTAEGGREATQYLRVPIERLDSLVSLVGEMVVNRSAFHQRLADLEDRIENLSISLSRFRGVTHEVETRYSVEALRNGVNSNLAMNGGFVPVGHSANDSMANTGDVSGDRRTGPAGRRELDSLEFDRYTEFHLLARTLAETTSDVALITSEFRNLHGDFESLLGRQQRLNRDAQDSLMRIRMVPVANIVNRLDRTVRSVASKVGKNVELEVVGEGTELDKTMLQEITDPLLHIIRNALDHGIESPQERALRNKPEKAVLRVEALNQGTQVTLRVIDDGGGLNTEKIRAKAIERGLVREDQTLTQQELQSLIFLPGFSTASSLTDVSGRGVGMDVVRDAVQRLKGTISVDSVPGQGSTFTIHLPTSLAVSRALLIESHGQTYAVPMQSVQQILRLDPGMVSYIGDDPIVQIGEQTHKLIDMAVHQQLRSSDDTVFDNARPMLVIRDGDDDMAVTVDKVFGGQDIVVKTLGDLLLKVPGLIGATIAGDGTVIPILDPAELVGSDQQRQSVGNWSSSADFSVADRRKVAMVIDDSISVRRVTANLLRSAGWDVMIAMDGVDALEKLDAAESDPDVFLCDMEMPRMDGIELIGRLRSRSEYAQTPIVMVTSRAGEKHRRLAREAGADDHIVKPFNDDQLIKTITQMVVDARQTVDA